MGEKADYTFNFILDTKIPKGGVIKLTFPDKYASGLGISAVSSSTCNILCSINSHVVTFNLETDFYNGTS